VKILVGLPTYDNTIDARLGLFLYGARRDNLSIDVKTRQLSVLCWCFNHLWAEALNNKTYDYFLMIHADIVPMAPTGWISKMIAEAENAKAHVLSAVAPIKNTDGLTSTALETAAHMQPRRLSMTEVMQLPQTFKAGDAAKVFGWSEHAEQRLLVNTGCMLVDLRRKRDVFETMCFKMIDGMERREGKFVPTFVPEDWDFSRQAIANGLTTAATRAIRLVHRGMADYANDSAWGTMQADMRIGQ